MNKKLEQRKFAKEILTNLSEDTRFEKSKKIAAYLSDFLRHLKTTQFPNLETLKIAAFCPIQTEVMWFLNMSDADYKFYFPTMNEDKSMTFYPVSVDQLKKRNWGTNFPAELKKNPTHGLPVVLTPGLLFGTKGERLGRGAGYYDRYLGNYDACKIGLAFDEQVVEGLQTETHDVQLDYIITDKCIYLCKGVDS